MDAGRGTETEVNQKYRRPLQARPGDILLFHRAVGFSRVITWITHSPYYHVAIYDGNRCVIESRPRGVVRRRLLSGRRGDFYRIIPAPGGRGEDALKWARGEVGAAYDTAAVVIILLEHIFRGLHVNYTPGNKFTCAEFVAVAFARAGLELFPGRPHDELVPADFAGPLAE